MLTNVDGVKNGENKRLTELGQEQYQELKNNGVVSDGMIPKMDSALEARKNGVGICRIVQVTSSNKISDFLLPGTEAGTSIVA